MYLLSYDGQGQLILSDFERGNVPPYACLSHTWGADEVTFKDIRDHEGKSKEGFRKIEFCMKQAAIDGLDYSWVDACCIDKRNLVELSEAINSMFRWYQNAVKCYVYLADVDATTFQSSRWFSRGWTLQELLAPSTVQFHTATGALLGDKGALVAEIHNRTKIPVSALMGRPLNEFSIEERLAWVAGRETKLEEDLAYCLLGIFEISMPLIYGEGRERAEFRLHKSIEESRPAANASIGRETDRQEYKLPFGLPGAPVISSFVGRGHEIERIQQALPFNDSRGVAVLYGVGGVGKTQISIEYAKRLHQSYTAVLWLDGRDETSLQQSFVNLARRLSKAHPSIMPFQLALQSSNLAEASAAVQDWLDLPENNRWLLIIDNVDDPHIPGVVEGLYDIRHYLPTTLHGHVLITTRSSYLRIGKQIHVQKLEEYEECVQILKVSSQRPDIEHESKTMELIRRLDGLPLALATAGAYLSQDVDSVADYLEEYQRSWLELQRSGPHLPEHEGRTLENTWNMSYRRVENKDPSICRLLKLWGCLSNHDLWFELLEAGREEAPSWFVEITKTRLSFKKHMQVLCSYGLAEARQDTGAYGMHACIHDWVCEVLNDDLDEEIAKLALRCISHSRPEDQEGEYWVVQRRLLGHADSYLRCAARRSWDFDMHAHLHNIALLYHDQGKYAESETVHLQALKGCEKSLGPEHHSTLSMMNNIGNLYRDQDRFIEAKAMFTRALEGYQKKLDETHPSVLNTIHNLGLVHNDLDERTKAVELLSRSLKGKVSVWGDDHVVTLDTVVALGNLYRSQENFAEAEAHYTRGITGYEKKSGPEHVTTLGAVNNLGLLYTSLGRFSDAERLYVRALEGYEKALGQAHISTMNTAVNLGGNYRDQGRLSEAEALFEKSLATCETAFSKDHLCTMDILDSLGLVYREMGKLAKAEHVQMRALAGKEKILGREHSSTLETVNNLGLVYMEIGRPEEAEAFFNRALQGYERQSDGRQKPIFDTLTNLALVHQELGRLQEAEKMYARALDGYQRVYGSDHTSTIGTKINLASLYRVSGRLTAAESMMEPALESLRQQLGQHHGTTLAATHNLGNIYQDQGKLVEAEAMYASALEGYKQVLGPDHTRTLDTARTLTNVRKQLERPDTAAEN